MGDEPWPPAAVGPPSDEAAARDGRLGWAFFLLLVAFASGGLTFGVLQVEGLAAMSGQRAVARISRCDKGRQASCFAVVQTPAGVTLHTNAEMPISGASKGDEIRVRYRAGKAVPDTAWGRIRPLVLVTAFGVASVAALVGAIVAATRRR